MAFHQPKYVVELYRSRSDPRSLQETVDLLAAGARQLSAEGTIVRHVDTIFLPGDETCLHVFEADSEAVVRAVVDHIGIDADRVIPAEQVGRLDVASPGIAECGKALGP